MKKYDEKQGTGPNPVFDSQELAKLARLCLGSSSTIEFSQRTGLSRSFLSAVLNANLRGRPSRRSLKKMASPNAQPQNGVTEEQLLRAAGYDPDDLAPVPAAEAPAAQKGSAFLDEVQQYCAADIDRMCAAAQCMVGELIKRNTSPKFTLSVERSWVSISEELLNDEPPLLHICIPAFVPEEHMVPVAVPAALLQFGEAQRQYKDQHAQFHILTDSESLFNFLSKSFLSEMCLEILLTKETVVCRRYPAKVTNNNII